MKNLSKGNHREILAKTKQQSERNSISVNFFCVSDGSHPGKKSDGEKYN